MHGYIGIERGMVPETSRGEYLAGVGGSVTTERT